MKPTKFPATVYVYEEVEANSRNKYFVLVEDPKDRIDDGLVGVYELRSTIKVRHTVEISDETTTSPKSSA